MSQTTESETLFALRKENGKPTSRRRRASSLRGEPPGDTAGPALATMFDRSPASHMSAPTTTSQKTSSDRSHRGRKRRKVKSLFRRWISISFRHTWLNPLIACLVIAALYLVNPHESNPLHSALFLSYPLPREPEAAPDTPIQYGKGARDFAFVGFYIIFLSFTREFIMQRVLRPLAIKAGMKTRGKQSRFMEQGYTALYFSVFGPFGMYVMSRTPVWYFSTEGMYAGFPHKTHEADFKAYYLLQASYWAQQMIVLLLMLEKPRKDFKELVAHHIITLSLIYLSYRFHFTYMGLAIYITMDISDFFLATSKCLNYIDAPVVIPYFIFFLFAWAYLRHYINLVVLWSLLPLPMPFPEPINDKILSTLSTLTASTSSTLAILSPITTPLLATLSTIFPETVSLLQSAPTHISAFFNKQADFATVGPYALDWSTQQYKCWISQWIAFFLLLALQLVNVFWFFLILRILYRLAVSWGQTVEDVRSEDDEEMDGEERKEELEGLRREQGGVWENGKEEEREPSVKVLVNGEVVGEEIGES